jgi:hypothetical protein
MTGAGAVLLREFEERWQILAGALLVGLLSLALPRLGRVEPEFLGDIALTIGAITSCVAAFILGAVVIGRELAERRMSFFFSRPLSGAAIWSGKLAGAALLALLCGVLSALPAGLLHALHGNPIPELLQVSSLSNWGLCLILLLLGANAAGILLRERSAWLLLDFAAFCIVAFWLATAGRQPALAGAGEAFKRVWFPALILIAVSLAAAGAVQAIHGRSDLSRGRRLLSWTLWPLLLLVTLGVNGFAHWVVSPRLRDLRNIEHAVVAPAGDWVYVAGFVAGRPGYRPGFLIHTRSGRLERLRRSPNTSFGEPLVFSGDGLHLAFLRSPAESGGWELSTLDLSRSRAEPQSLGAIPMNGPIPVLQMSRDGRFLAVVDQRRTIVHDLPGNRIVASVPLSVPASFDPSTFARFPDAGHLRLFQASCRDTWPNFAGCRIQIENLDLTTGQLTPGGSLETVFPFINISQDGSRILAYTEQTVALYDGATAEKIADLAPRKEIDSGLQLMPDGRILLTAKSSPGRELRIFPADGRGEPRRHLFPDAERLQVAGQPARNRLNVAVFPGGEIWSLDLRTDQRRQIGKGLVPFARSVQVAGPASAAPWLFQRGEQLVQIDPATGRERVLTGPAAEAR